MFAHGVGECAGAPQKHSTVPEKISSRYEFCGVMRIRFFSEAPYPQHAVFASTPGFDVAVSGLWPCRSDAEHHDVLALRSDLNSALQSRAIGLLIRDHVIRREHSYHCVWSVPLKQKRHQSNRWPGIAPRRFGKNLCRRKPGKLLADRGAKIVV